jgi:hypothetical protein
MDPGTSIGPAQAGIQVTIADAAWHRLLRDPVRLVRRAMDAAGARASVVLTSTPATVAATSPPTC